MLSYLPRGPMHGATPNTMTYPIKESRPKKQKREQASSLLTDFCNLPLEVPLQHFCCILWDFPGGASGKESACQCRRHKRHGFNPWVRKIPWRRVWQPTPVFLPGESHRQRSLASYSPWGCKESDTIERLTHTHTHSLIY